MSEQVTKTPDRTVNVISPDEPVTCPKCGLRAPLVATGPCDEVHGTEVFEAMCQEHGEFRWCVEGEEDEDQ